MGCATVSNVCWDTPLVVQQVEVTLLAESGARSDTPLWITHLLLRISQMRDDISIILSRIAAETTRREIFKLFPAIARSPTSSHFPVTFFMSKESPQRPLQSYVLVLSVLSPDFKPPIPTIFSDRVFRSDFARPCGPDLAKTMRERMSKVFRLFWCPQLTWKMPDESDGNFSTMAAAASSREIWRLRKFFEKMNLGYASVKGVSRGYVWATTLKKGI